MPPEATVLVVEREPQVRRLLREILLREGINVFEAQNVDAALRFCSTHAGHVDVFVSDEQYPELAQIARQRPEIRFIAFAGPSAPALPMSVLVLGKPFAPQAVVNAIRSLVQPGATFSGAT
jgi:CheY-like chemotaxis protein